MKILAIMGSPRKGDSFRVTQMIEERMKKLGEVEFEYLFLKEANLGNCTGCHNCILTGEEKCPLRDDRDWIKGKMEEADGIIFVSPVYAQNVTALMKNLIDHFSYLYHRPCFFGKKAMGLAAGGGQFKETLGYLRQNCQAWGFDYVTAWEFLISRLLRQNTEPKLKGGWTRPPGFSIRKSETKRLAGRE